MPLMSELLSNVYSISILILILQTKKLVHTPGKLLVQFLWLGSTCPGTPAFVSNSAQMQALQSLAGF